MQKGRDKLAPSQPFHLGYGRAWTGQERAMYAPRYASRASSNFTSGNLPSIPITATRTATGYGYGTEVRLRPGSALVPTITGVPNMGAHPHTPTVPKEKPLRLSSSDSKAMEMLRPASRERRQHARCSTTDDALLRQGSRPTRAADRVLRQPPPRPPAPTRALSSSFHRHLSATQPLPPLPDPTDGHGEGDSQVGGSESSGETESSTEGSEIFSEEESEAPPSRPGFESDLERSLQAFDIPFPDNFNPTSPFPATIIQDHAQLNMERFAAGAHASGLSARVDNIVRAFRIHGPLDRELLSKALNAVAGFHPLLTATFQRGKDRLYLQTGQGKVSVELTSPIVGHDSPEDLIMNARRKIFLLQMRTDLCRNEREDSSEIGRALSVVSLGSGELSDSPGEKRKSVFPPLKKSVSFGLPPTVGTPAQMVTALPSLNGLATTPEEAASLRALMRARLIQKGPQEHILVISFPRVICDFWSSCLFMQQLTEAYFKLEKSASYRPSLAAVRIENKRQEVVRAYGKEKTRRTGHHRGVSGAARPIEYHRGVSGAARLLQKKPGHSPAFTPATPSRVHFQQFAHRENQLLKMLPKEKLWAFWENMVTATIRRQRGPNRVKVVPPVRIPSGLGEKMHSRARPQTSRLRPLTARNRPTTAARRQGSVLAEMGTTREALDGPQTLFHFIKFEEDTCASFRLSLPEDYLAGLDQDEVLSMMCLGAFVLMLGRCCRGWGTKERVTRERGDGASDSKLNCVSAAVSSIPELPRTQHPLVNDPLQQYSSDIVRKEAMAPNSPGRRMTRKTMMGERLDLGSFLLGVDVSLRDCSPRMTQGLFGPLTNNVGLRVNLSSCPTFADLAISLWKTLQLARNHGHFPFSTIAEEVGLIRGLPVRFSFLYHRDVVQLTDPDNFYFPETAIGLRGHGLARFGSNCYLTPLNTKMDDSCCFELLLWEGYDRCSVNGGFCYQPQAIRTELVELFGLELCRLLARVAEDPCRPLTDLALSISPPFVSTSRMRPRKR